MYDYMLDKMVGCTRFLFSFFCLITLKKGVRPQLHSVSARRKDCVIFL